MSASLLRLSATADPTRQFNDNLGMSTRWSPSPHRTQAGFSLLEALIAVALIGFAFLSAAGLHVQSLRDTQLSAQEIAAAQLADDMYTRMRVTSPLQLGSMLQTAGAQTSACYGTLGCNAVQMAADEVAKWKASIALRLPSGGGTVCRDAAPGDGSPANDNCTGGANDPIVVKLWWPVRSASATPVYRQFFLYYVAKP